jgi:hypothetical protein
VLSLIGDVGADALEEMAKTGFEPAVVVETSPNNFQVWLNQGRILSDRLLSTLAARPACPPVRRKSRELRLGAFWALGWIH